MIETKTETAAWLDTFTRGRKSATSIMSLCPTEPAGAIAAACAVVSADDPKVQWDCIAGWRALNEMGEAALAKAVGDEEARQVEYPSDALRQAKAMPERSVIFMHGLHRFFENRDPMAALTVQGIWNLREPFKSDRRTLVMVSPAMTLPTELTQDVLMIYETYPTEEQHATTLRELADSNGVTFADGLLDKAAGQLVGLNAYAGEQAASEAMIGSKGIGGININYLIDRKRSMIDAVQGLKVHTGGESFADVGGNDAIKEYWRWKLGGKRPPHVVVWIDEIEKAMAGSSGSQQDSSGTSQAMLQYMLTYQQDQGWDDGNIFIGHPGCSKSLIAKAMGTEANVPLIAMDMGSFKGSLVGETEERMRAALEVLKAIGGDRVHFIATCNGIGSLPPELRRRFSGGTYFFDLPEAEEQDPIWDIFFAKYEIEKPGKKAWTALRSATEEWTGAEIHSVVRNAWEFGISLEEAVRMVVPICVQAPDRVKSLREECSGRYLSAQRPGIYKFKKTREPVSSRQRALAVDADAYEE